MKTFPVHHPFIFAVLVSLIAILSQWWPTRLPALSQGVQIFLGRSTGVFLAVVLLTSLHWWQEAGFAPLKSWRLLFPYLPMILVALLVTISNVAPGIRVTDPSLILLGAMSFLAGGFIEESLFRGVVLRAFLPRGLLKAAIFSGVVFSLVHLANLLLGQDAGATGLQLVRAFLVGFAFVAPLAYTRNIWPLVILHALMNFTSFLGSGNITLISVESPKIDQVLGELIVFGLLSGYGFWLIHRTQKMARRPQPLSPVVSPLK